MKIFELEQEIENFCAGCPDCGDCGGYDDAWGAWEYFEEPVCRADFDPLDKRCAFRQQYQDLLEDLKWERAQEAEA